MGKRKKPIKLKIDPIDPFKISTGKDPVKQRPGAGPHQVRKKKKKKRAERKRTDGEEI